MFANLNRFAPSQVDAGLNEPNSRSIRFCVKKKNIGARWTRSISNHAGLSVRICTRFWETNRRFACLIGGCQSSHALTHMSSSFRRKGSRRNRDDRLLQGLKGTKPWTGGITLTSMGLRDLDSILGGGQPIGSCVLIEHDRWTRDLAQCLVKYWCAEVSQLKEEAVHVGNALGNFTHHNVFFCCKNRDCLMSIACFAHTNPVMTCLIGRNHHLH